MNAHLKRQPKFTAAVPILAGKQMDAAQLREAFKQGCFQYQFLPTDHRSRSRIMRCSNEGELEWIITQLGGGSKVVVQVGNF